MGAAPADLSQLHRTGRSPPKKRRSCLMCSEMKLRRTSWMSMSSHKKKALPLLRLRWQKQRANGMYVQQYVQIYFFFY